MPVAIEARRFVKHKTYHIILQEVRKQSFGSRSSDHDVIDKNEHFHLQSTPCANVWTGTKGSNRITLIRILVDLGWVYQSTISKESDKQ